MVPEAVAEAADMVEVAIPEEAVWLTPAPEADPEAVPELGKTGAEPDADGATDGAADADALTDGAAEVVLEGALLELETATSPCATVKVPDCARIPLDPLDGSLFRLTA